MRRLALGLALVLVLAATPAEARRHHHRALCAPGKFLIVHEGRCVSKSVVEPPRRVREAMREEPPPPPPRVERGRRRGHPADPMNGDPIEDRVIDTPAQCAAPTEWMPNPIGWPRAWVKNRGFKNLSEGSHWWQQF